MSAPGNAFAHALLREFLVIGEWIELVLYKDSFSSDAYSMPMVTTR